MKKKFLIVIDESEELEKAIYFAANRAIHTEGELSLLYIVDPAINAQWSRIENLIEQEATSEAKKLCRVWAQKIKSRFGIDSEMIIKMGDRCEELLKVIEDDKNIRFLVLASRANNEEPGPLIKALTGKKIKNLSIPMVVIPGSLSEKEIDLIV
ncbi:universal stress protein [Pelagibacteraceae bacterium]|jgi:nucleotide-binding universal stress UspA family protein|nr:universal stress protein [Pelagibacteraceae bacterium]